MTSEEIRTGRYTLPFDSSNIDWQKGDGLVPAIVQHRITGRVLMLGYMNEQSLARTCESGLVTFYSRSRESLWCKGETSGNVLNLVALSLDCDRDTLLVEAVPAGPTCHLNRPSCFDTEASVRSGFGFLGELQDTIVSRKPSDAQETPARTSYTASLFDAGTARMAQKVGEEGVEVALAAVQQNREELIDESADLLYHLMVLLASQDLDIEDIAVRLENRSS